MGLVSRSFGRAFPLEINQGSGPASGHAQFQAVQWAENSFNQTLPIGVSYAHTVIRGAINLQPDHNYMSHQVSTGGSLRAISSRAGSKDAAWLQRVAALRVMGDF
ncbi:MAG: hypothetical protein EBS05_17930 [Proteobacteria bacterium]|jgi:hypothetical protein|nr:hypothetical protein [Pseudomonadota bacterium]